MKWKIIPAVFLFGFLGWCGFLVWDSGLFRGECPTGVCIPPLAATAQAQPLETEAPTAEPQPEIEAPSLAADPDAPEQPQSIFDLSSIGVYSQRQSQLVQIGSIEEESGYKFQLTLTTHGAAVARATMSEFANRDPDNPEPLELLTPVQEGSRTVYSLASRYFTIAGTGLRTPLYRAEWQVDEPVRDAATGMQSLRFWTLLRDAQGRDVIRLTKTYRIAKGSYNLEIDMAVENLTDLNLEAAAELQGPAGINQEAVRQDMRDIMAAYLTEDGKVVSNRRDIRKLAKAGTAREMQDMLADLRRPDAGFLWAAITNKYFAAILRPVPPGELSVAPRMSLDELKYYPTTQEAPNVSFVMGMAMPELAMAGLEQSVQRFSYQLYLGPKDKDVFDDNPLYLKLGYYQTINFMSCCCPQAVINPLAFGVMALMNLMYRAMGPLGNYGVVIMVLVVLVRVLMHPITKKSQVSMMAMQRLGPRMEEIKKKYASDPKEMNQAVMQLYREQGVSPFASFLPIFAQMPIWIALWSAVNTNIELRGAGFLPFWITDLSAPDALVRFPEFTIPIVGWGLSSLNLLPILLGVVMFLQQKLMTNPAQQAAQTNPQMAQQQKMMMWMMPLLFPLMLYSAPSGVNLYIMSSMAAGVAEQAVIRKHLREKQEQEKLSENIVPATKKTGGKVKKKKPKPFFKTNR